MTTQRTDAPQLADDPVGGDRTTTVEAVVVGAGPAGLAAAAMLRRAGVRAVVLERTEVLAAPWHNHYDALSIQSPPSMSYLPGYRYRRSDGRWISRDAFIAYLDRYVRHHQIDVRHCVEVHRVDQFAGGWRVQTSVGDWTVPVVVVATGHSRVPWTPAWPGLDSYTGQFLHSSAFRNAEPFCGRDVLLVGTGNSGAEIASIVARGGARRTRIAVRSAPSVVPRVALGVPSLWAAAMVEPLPPRVGDIILRVINRPFIGNLSRYGLPVPQRGIYSQFLAKEGMVPIMDTGFVGALKAGLIEPVAAVVGMDREQVLLADGSRISPEVVIAATGFRCGLEPLVGHLGVVRENGEPGYNGAQASDQAPGLYFIGYAPSFKGRLGQVRRDTPKLARAVRAYLSGARPRGRRQDLAAPPPGHPVQNAPKEDPLAVS